MILVVLLLWKAWVYADSLTTDSSSYNALDSIFESIDWNSQLGQYSFGISHENKLYFYIFDSNNTFYYGTTVLSTQQWYHLAVSRDGSGNIRLFVNGELESTNSNSYSLSNSNQPNPARIGGCKINNSGSGIQKSFDGFISNLRVVKGTTLYTSDFNPSSTPPTAVTNTKLLCCKSTTSVTDADVIPGFGTITANGDPEVSTSNPFSAGSSYFNNSSLQLTSTADLCPGTSDFTFECWLRPTNWGSSWETVYYNGVYNGLFIGKDDSGNFVVRASSNTSFITQSTLPSVNQWTHIAVTRQGSTLKLFYDGVLKNSVSNSHNFPTAATAIAQTTGNGEGINGRISNLRFIKGTALYTSNFTVPTEKLTDVTNTKLLCCQTSGPVTAAAVTPSIITTNGNPTGSTSSPFLDVDGGGSLYLDGSSVVKITSDSAAASIFNLPSNTAFTIEAWVYPTSLGSYNNIMSGWDSSCNHRGILFHITSGGQIFFGGPGGSTYSSNASSSGVVTTNKWHHVAVTRNNSGDGEFYIDGVSAGSFSNNSEMNNHGCGVFIGANMDGYADGSGGMFRFTGYISNLRYVVGHETYTSGFTPSTQPFTPTSQGVPSGACKFLACQDETSIDTNSISVPMTADYGFPLASGKNPFSADSTGGAAETSGSVSFDGNGDYLSIADSNDFNLGSGDFTIEAYVYANSFGTWDGIIGQWPQNSGNVANSWVLELVGGSLHFYYVVGSTYYGPINGGNLSTSTWHHVAAVRSGNTMYMFKDGVLYGGSGQSVTHTFNNPTSDVTIGGNIASGGYLNGKISNLRLVKGTALYTSNFTSPTAALTDVTNTKLLCCQSAGSATDAAVTPGTITAYGNVAASSSSPFATGSLSLDGSGDCLTVPDNADFEFGSGNFTLEAFINYTGSPGTGNSTYTIFSKWDNVNSNKGFILRISDDGSGDNLQFFHTTDGSSNNTTTGSTVLSPGTWYHIAFVRNGSTGTFYIDGVADSTTHSMGSDSIRNTTVPFRIGANLGSSAIVQEFNGLISNVRVLKGNALYTSNFTAPTSSLTAVNNTKLLCCQSTTDATAAAVAPGSIAANGNAAASSSNPF